MTISVYPERRLPTMQTTPFNEQVASERTSVVALDPTRGLSVIRDLPTTVGAGTIVQTTNEYELDVTGGADEATLDTIERMRSQAGMGFETSIGIRIPTPATGNQIARWGCFSDPDGLGFGQDATGLFVFRREGGGETAVPQASWNIDSMDGTGPSGLTLDPTAGLLYRAEYVQAYSQIDFKVVLNDGSDRQRQYIVHRMHVVGASAQPRWGQPIRIQTASGSTAGTYEVFVGSRTYDCLGRFAPLVRTLMEFRNLESIGNGTWVPLISFRKKTTGNFPLIPVHLSGLVVNGDDVAVLQCRLNGFLTGEVFATPSEANPAETACESDFQATDITGGEVIWGGLGGADQTGAGSNHTDIYGEPFGPRRRLECAAGSTITLCAFGTTGGPNIISALRWEEEW